MSMSEQCGRDSKGYVELDEEQIGSYQAPQMIVTIGRKAVRLEPVGTFIIGAKGRVMS